jgi:hypothetical protein
VLFGGAVRANEESTRFTRIIALRRTNMVKFQQARTIFATVDNEGIGMPA